MLRAPAVLALLVAACTSHAQPAVPAQPVATVPAQPVDAPPPPSAMEQFLAILEHGGSLYGLGVGCDEWLATPESSDVPDEESDDEDDVADEARESEPPPEPRIEGRFAARDADASGRIYGFDYFLRKSELGRITITGRGGWSPAPGVTIPAEEPGWVIIGTGSYCLARYDLRESPTARDAVKIGSESWYLSRDACLRERTAVALAGTCSKP